MAFVVPVWPTSLLSTRLQQVAVEGEKLVYHPGWVAKVIQVRPVCCRPLTTTHIPHGKCDCSAVCAARHAGWLQLSDFMSPSIPVPKLFSCTRRRWSDTASCWWDPPEAARPRSSAACARPSTRRWASRTRTAASTPRPSARRKCTEKWIPAPENGTQVCIAQLVFLSTCLSFPLFANSAGFFLPAYQEAMHHRAA